MAISEETILEPEMPKPGIPLKRSTLVVLLVGALVAVFLSSLIFSGGTSARPPSPVVKDPSEIRQTGNNQVLNDEESRAAMAAKAAASAPPRPPIPAVVKREDNSAAFYDQQRQAKRPTGPDKDLEMEAATRSARAVVFDSDDGHAVSRAGKQLRSALTGSASGAGAESPSLPEPAAQGVKAPSDALAPQLDALKRSIAEQRGPVPTNWAKEYAQELSERSGRTIHGHQAPRGLVLRQGKIIPAVLGRQINSDLPGRITAYVSSNVYDSAGNLLIPMGSSLVGQYDSGVKVGQDRLMFAFERLVLPNGYSFDLPAAGGVDLSGASGLAGDVDNHFFKMFGTSLLIAVLADKGTKQPSNVTQFGTSGPVTAAGQVLSDVSKSILERNRTIAPTITVEQGTRLNVEVAADMVFPGSYRPN